MKKVSSCLMVAVLLLTTVLLCGCSSFRDISGSRKRPQYSIGVALKAANSPYWMDMQTGMQKAAADYDVDLTLVYPSDESQTEEQNQLIKDLLDSDIDLLLAAPCDCFGASWIAKTAEEKNIPFLSVDDRAVNSKVPYIGSDNKRIGRDAGEYFNETLPEGSSVYVVLGPYNQMSCQERLYGIRSTLSDSIALEHVEYTDMTEKDAYRCIMQAKEPIDGVFCHNIIAAQGVIAALQERGWDAEIITVDTKEDAMRVLNQKKIDAFFEQDGYKIGYQAIKTAFETLQNGELPEGNVLFRSKLITNANQEEE